MDQIRKLETIKDFVSLLIKSENMRKTDFKSLFESEQYKKLFHKIKSIPNNELLEIIKRQKLFEFLYENNFLKLHLKNIHLLLKKSYYKIIFQNLKNIYQQKLVLETLENHGIKFLVLKGAAISIQTKGFYSGRISSDLDLFINKKDLLNSIKILEKYGYKTQHVYFNKKTNVIFQFLSNELSLINNKKQTVYNIDLHWKLINEDKNLPCFEKAWSSGSEIQNKNNLNFKTLNFYDSFKYACAHATKDKWMNLNNLLDIHYLAKKISKSDLIKFTKLKEVRLGLYATYLLTKDDHYKFKENINKLEKIYIKKISQYFQKLPNKFKGLNKSNPKINLISIFHQIYLTNSLLDIFFLSIKIGWFIVPNILKLNLKRFIFN